MTRPARIPIAVLVCRELAPYGRGAEPAALSVLREAGARVEIVAGSDSDEEFVHLGSGGELVHRISPERSYSFKAARKVLGRVAPAPPFALRAAEKLAELESIWNRRVESIHGAPELRRFPWLASRVGARPRAGPRRQATPRAGKVDVIVPSYNRFEELLESLPTVLEEIRTSPVQAHLTIVFQNEGFPERLLAARPEWRARGIHFVWSAPPSLTRARNAGIGATDGGLVIFVDDDVHLAPGFIQAHLGALARSPGAIGVAGRVRTRLSGGRATPARQVGQVRWSGHVDANFESVHGASVLVPHSPMGTNMSFLRAPMTRLLGASWFDESLGGSAWREETTLGVELFRRGEHLVFAPEAALYHFESVLGGCENRTLTQQRREARLLLENRFLRSLYRDSLPMRALGGLLLAAREVRESGGERANAALRSARAYLRSRRG